MTGTLLGLHLLASAAPTAAPVVTFDTTPRAGQHQRQQMDIDATIKMRMESGPDATDEQRAKHAQVAAGMSQNGPLKMKMRMLQTLKVDAADATGWLPMTVSMASLAGTVQVGGKTIPVPKNDAGNITVAARFNPKDFSYELQRLEGGPSELNEAMAKQGQLMVGEALQLYKALAARPLKVGESVEVPLMMKLPVPLPGGAGDMQSTLRYTLKRVDKGVAHFDIGMDLKMNMDVPMPRPPAAAASAAPAASAASEAAPNGVAATQPPAAPAVLHMVATGSGKGTSALRLSDRLPLHNQLSMSMQMDMSGPDNSRMLMDMDMTVQSKGESLAKPAVKTKP